MLACGKGSRGGCGTSRWPRTSSNTFCGIYFKTLFKLECEKTYVRLGSVYLPSTSGAFFARVEGGSMGRGQSNRFSPYWEQRGEILYFSCCYFSSYYYFKALSLAGQLCSRRGHLRRVLMVELVEVRKDVCPGLSLCTQRWAQFQLGRLGIVGVVDEHNQKRTITPCRARNKLCQSRHSRTKGLSPHAGSAFLLPLIL